MSFQTRIATLIENGQLLVSEAGRVEGPRYRAEYAIVGKRYLEVLFDPSAGTSAYGLPLILEFKILQTRAKNWQVELC